MGLGILDDRVMEQVPGLSSTIWFRRAAVNINQRHDTLL